ncbi:MAG: endonuclease domain-containing protein [Sphingomonadales bacterium]|nr:endonuclease domain-containing protein [Sphingomonadales bacterium]
MKKISVSGSVGRARLLRKNMTEAEKKLWALLSRRNLAGVRFRRQVPLGPYIVDFASHEVKLIIELDGGQHAVQSSADAKRSEFLNMQGYRVLRFWNNDVMDNLEGVHGTILENLRLTSPHSDLSPAMEKGDRPAENN